MVCRQNAASSVAIALARSGSWLDDAQVQSIVHRLRHEFSSSQPPEGWNRDVSLHRELDRAQHAITTNPNFRPQRRAGLQARLDRARTVNDGLADDTLWALQRLPDGVAAAQAALDARLGEIAGQQGMSRREARAAFHALREQAPGGRQRRANAEELRDLGAIPGDAATRHALHALRTREPVLPPVRLVQQWIPVHHPGDSADRAHGTDGDTGANRVTHLGTSTLSDRVEVRRRDGSTAAYRVSRADIDDLVAMTHRGPLTDEAVSWTERRGTRIPRAEQTAYAVRCDDCGQFVGDVLHQCPLRGPAALVTQQQIVDGSSRLAVPDPAQMAELLEANHHRPVEVPIAHLTNDAEVEGTVRLRSGSAVVRGLDRTTRQLVDLDDVGDDELTCRTCHSVDCAHVAHTREAVRDHMHAAGELPQTERSSALYADQIRIQPRAAAPAAATAPAVAESFLSNPDAFRQAIRDSGPSREVPFYTENALQGYAANTGFGIEIEFDATTMDGPDQVGRELYARGLLTGPHQRGYHSGARSGYSGWVYEHDGSVRGGELVTPVMADNPEHWGQIATVCETIRRNGGITDHAGSHTNISSAQYTPQMAWRLVNLIRANEDDIYRMGRTRRSARSSGYNQPLPGYDPGPVWTSSHQATSYQGGRETMINFYNAFQSRSGRIEFRFPDASHDPGVIQAQVSLCAAMTNYVRTNDVQPGPVRRLHTARREGWALNLMAASATDFEERTRPVRTLIDTLFSTDRDRRQIAALWGRGSYYRDQ